METVPSIRIAIADAYVVTREAIKMLLHRYGMQVVVEADNGKQLMESIERCQNLPELCILEIDMPTMNGLQTLRALKRKAPDMPVLVLTHTDNQQYILRMLKEGASGYLHKSCRPEELRKAILLVNDKKEHYPEKISTQLYKALKNGNEKLQYLTASEIKVLEYAGSDMTIKEIAEKLGVSQKSFEGHRDSLHRKLGINNRGSLTKFVIENGIIPIKINCQDGGGFYKKDED